MSSWWSLRSRSTVLRVRETVLTRVLPHGASAAGLQSSASRRPSSPGSSPMEPLQVYGPLHQGDRPHLGPSPWSLCSRSIVLCVRETVLTWVLPHGASTAGLQSSASGRLSSPGSAVTRSWVQWPSLCPSPVFSAASDPVTTGSELLSTS